MVEGRKRLQVMNEAPEEQGVCNASSVHEYLGVKAEWHESLYQWGEVWG